MTKPSPLVYVSTCAFENRELRTLLASCQTHGIDAIELSAVEGYSLEFLERARQWASLLVHNYFPPPAAPFLLNIASQNPIALRRTIEFCKAAIDLAERLDSPVYGIHGGFAVDIPTHLLGLPVEQAKLVESGLPDREVLYATILDSVRELNDYASPRGVKLLVENNVISSRSGKEARRLLPMAEAAELTRLVRDVGDPNFGLLLDVGHAKVSSVACGFDLETFVAEVAPHVRALHLSDNDGVEDRNAPFGKNAWFVPHLRHFASSAVTLELSCLAPDRIIEVRDLVREAL
ncbi:sugar phosphate isomerase/epimerase [Acidobacteria bacterium AH-259-O06]|nr:sugar phosphate isomerase/epimerase [Acidobacteria bacterium AH-259-O06]